MQSNAKNVHSMTLVFSTYFMLMTFDSTLPMTNAKTAIIWNDMLVEATQY